MEMLRKLRREKGITMKELGETVGVAESTISQYETGKRSPDFETLLKFGEFFNVSTDYLLGRSDTKKFPAEAGDQKLSKEEKDIEKILAQAKEQLMDAEGLMFDGEPASPEAIDSILSAMKIGIAMAKEENKKYIPKKYRKD